MNKMIHKTEIENFQGSTTMLVEEIGNLRYDALAEFLDLLSKKLRLDGEKDLAKERIQLANALFDCSAKLNESKQAIDKA